MIKDQIIKAYTFAEEAHKGVERKFSGLPYFSHVKFVARTLENLNVDTELIIAGFLHDVIEDTDKTYEEVKELFGEKVARLIQGVSNDGEAMKAAGGKRMYLAQKMSSMSDDELTLKLADRFHNVLFLEHDATPEFFIKKSYKETNFILFAIEEDGRVLKDVHNVLIARIKAILGFLKIRYNYE